MGREESAQQAKDAAKAKEEAARAKKQTQRDKQACLSASLADDLQSSPDTVVCVEMNAPN